MARCVGAQGHVTTAKHARKHASIMTSLQVADPVGGNWDNHPPKTYESNFIHHNFVQIGKQHSRFKGILSLTALLHQSCEVCFTPLTLARLL